MPQPLSSINKEYGLVTMDSDVPLRNPKLGAEIAAVINTFSHLEIELGESLANLLGTKAETGVAMYLSLTSTASQLAILEAAAQNGLDEKRHELFLALMSLVRTAAKTRNTIAHGLWARARLLPDNILLISPRAYLEFRGKRIAGRRGIRGIERGEIMVYGQRDFVQTREMIGRVTRHFHSFWWMASRKGAYRATLLRKLRNEPDVHEALSRLRRRRKSSP